MLLSACSSAVAPVEASCRVSDFVSQPPLVIAHANGNVLAPANTLLSLQAGLDAGADVLDLDLRMTSDGVIVARHDRDLSTTTNGSGPIDQQTWAEIADLDAAVNFDGDVSGARIARLDEALATFSDVWFSLELKQTVPSMSEPLCDLLTASGDADRVFISANDDEAAYAFNDVCGEVLLTTTYRDLDMRAAAEARDEWWCAPSPIGQPPFGDRITAELVESSHAHGSALFVWTVNDPDDIRRAVEIGVDGIYTDRPDLARQIIDDLRPNR